MFKHIYTCRYLRVYMATIEELFLWKHSLETCENNEMFITCLASNPETQEVEEPGAEPAAEASAACLAPALCKNPANKLIAFHVWESTIGKLPGPSGSSFLSKSTYFWWLVEKMHCPSSTRTWPMSHPGIQEAAPSCRWSACSCGCCFLASFL